MKTNRAKVEREDRITTTFTISSSFIQQRLFRHHNPHKHPIKTTPIAATLPTLTSNNLYPKQYAPHHACRRSVAASTTALTQRRSTPPRSCSLPQAHSPSRRRKRQPRSPCLAATPAQLIQQCSSGKHSGESKVIVSCVHSSYISYMHHVPNDMRRNTDIPRVSALYTTDAEPIRINERD